MNKSYSSIVVKTFLCLFLFFGFALDGFSQVDTSSAICPPMKDHEGNTYNAILVDGYCWTVPPLRTKYNRDGKALPFSSYRSLWDENGKIIDTTVWWYVGGTPLNIDDLQAIHTPMCFEGLYMGEYLEDTNYFFYNWSAATEACPIGWHLPSKDEWIHLIESPMLSPECIVSQVFMGEDANDYVAWSSTEFSKDTALIWYRITGEFVQILDDGGWIVKSPKGSIGEVHCVRDEEVCPKMKDYDGNTYSTVAIGKQCWTAENLRTTHDRNGKLISLGNETSSVRAYRYPPMRNEDHVGQYGYLYNYPAAANICPKGWHLPSNDDWDQLFMELDASNTDKAMVFLSSTDEGNGAKAIASKDGWIEVGDLSEFYSNYEDFVGYHPEKNNSTGFNARPAGAYADGIYKLFEYAACFWSTFQSNDNYSYDSSLGMLLLVSDFAGRGTSYCDETVGLSVRCVRD